MFRMEQKPRGPGRRSPSGSKGDNVNDSTIIIARGLTRTYTRTIRTGGFRESLKNLFHHKTERLEAVKGLDLEVERGEILGLIGPNGAGKTTLVKMLTGILEPTEGSVSVLGFRPSERREAFLSRIALVMGQKSQLWPDLPARDGFTLNRAIYAIPRQRFDGTLARLAAAVGAENLLDTPVRTLSLGERMKVEFIAAMLHEPAVVFLDEPTIGLDAPSQRCIREFLLRENRERGVTILLTSHYMEDIRKLCGRTVVISNGVKTWDGRTEEMLDSVREGPDEEMADLVERLYSKGGRDE
jgi:ABC-2 type transport system ATP-binding protein